MDPFICANQHQGDAQGDAQDSCSQKGVHACAACGLVLVSLSPDINERASMLSYGTVLQQTLSSSTLARPQAGLQEPSSQILMETSMGA